MLTVLLLGASSGVGKALLRRNDALKQFRFVIPDGRNGKWRMGEHLDLQSIDFVIHLAHDRKMNEHEFNTLNLNLIQQIKVPILYLSSMSAHQDAQSAYGRTKFLAEQLVLQKHGIVLKSGIICGEEPFGIYRTIKILAKSPFTILPSSTNALFFAVKLEELVECILNHLHSFLPGVYFSSNEKVFAFQDLLSVISHHASRTVRIPDKLFNKIVWLASKFLGSQFRERVNVLYENPPRLEFCTHKCSFTPVFDN